MRSFVLAALLTALVAGLGAALAPERPALALRDASPSLVAGDAAAADARAGSAEAAGALESGPAQAAPRPSSTFYQWTDERGSVRFARSLAEVPPAWRERAGRVEVDTSAYLPRTPASRARPSLRVRNPTAGARAESAHDVTVYTTSWCGWCRKTLAFLDQRGVDYVNKDIEKNEMWADELHEKSGGRSIPFVEIDGMQIRGYNPHEMAALLE